MGMTERSSASREEITDAAEGCLLGGQLAMLWLCGRVEWGESKNERGKERECDIRGKSGSDGHLNGIGLESGNIG